MNLPSGLVTSTTALANKRICSHPLTVISEILRIQQREHQVSEKPDRDEQRDGRLKLHVALCLAAAARNRTRTPTPRQRTAPKWPRRSDRPSVRPARSGS